MNANSIAILGGGIAGLIAAIDLEQAGFDCTIIERNTQIGGRLRTEFDQKIPLDHGFQVLLTAYPLAKQYLDYSKLDLKQFKPGAMIFKNGEKTYLGDPQRDSSVTWTTINSWAGSFNDKLKIFSLSKKLKRKSIEEIFETSELSTLQYLKNYGFSGKVIENFFRPFFSGIFLEDKLETSSRMFEFIFKMFSEGNAAIPAKGIAQIPVQLAQGLNNTEIILETEATISEIGEISLGNAKKWTPKAIVQTFPDQNADIEWKGCTTLYFKTEENIMEFNTIGLLSDPSSIINSFYYLNETSRDIKSNVISVTTLEHLLEDAELISTIEKELNTFLGIKNAELIKAIKVPISLPVQTDVGEKDQSSLQLINGIPIVKAGDFLNYGSLNGAMLSGQHAANALINHFKIA